MEASFKRLFLLPLCFAVMFTHSMYSQSSTAELISTIPPPVIDGIRATDGSRAVTVWDTLLLVTNYWNGLQVVDIARIEQPRELAFFPLEDQAHRTVVSGSRIYVANHSSGIQVLNLSALPKLERLATVPTPGPALDLVAGDSLLYVALGQAGFCIMNVADLSQPRTLVLEVPGGWIQSIARQGTQLFLAAKREGILLYDISRPDFPRKIFQYRTGFDAMYVQPEDSLLYVADGGGGLLILDIRRVDSPEVLVRVPTQGFVTHLHKVGNFAYLANLDMGLQIVNVSDPRHPVLESTYLTESQVYGVEKQDEYVFTAANTQTLILRHNQAPRMKPVGKLVLRENEPFQMQLDVYDPDGDPLTLRALHLPAGSEFDSIHYVFRWKPSFDQAGLYTDIVFQAIENTRSRLSVADTVQITVENVNRPPDLPSLAPLQVKENERVVLHLPEGSDPDPEDRGRLTYRAENLPAGAYFDADSLVFRWRPNFNQAGVYIIDFVLEDGGGGADREPLTITVENVDRPPVVASLQDLTIPEGKPFQLVVRATDPDSEDAAQLRIKMEHLPSGAVFDSTRAMFLWTPDYDAAGVYPDIRVIALSGSLSDTARFTLTVTHVNRPPVLADLPPFTVQEQQLLRFRIQGSDPDREDSARLSYRAENLPPGASFDADSLAFRWRPTYEQAGIYRDVAFVVSDPAGLSDRKTTTITVANVNRPPQLSPPSPLTGRENEPLGFQLAASDPDSEDAGRLTYFADHLPAGAHLDATSGRFQWLPSFDQAGDYRILVGVRDGESADSAFLEIHVENTNRPPQLNVPENLTAREGEPLVAQIQASDPDLEDSLKLALSIESLPEGARFNPATGQLNWTPTFRQAGRYTLTVKATDGKAESTRTVSLVVENVNRPPALTVPATIEGKEGEPLQFNVTATDPDEEDQGKLQLKAISLPEGAEFDPQTGTFSWQPGYEQAGEYEVQFEVTDAAGLKATALCKITVMDVPKL